VVIEGPWQEFLKSGGKAMKSRPFIDMKLLLMKNWKVLIPLLVLYLHRSLFYPGRLTDPYLRGDERANLNVALNILTYSATQGPYSTELPFPMGPNGFWSSPPLYYVLISPIAYSPFLCRMFSLMLSYFSLVLVYTIAERRISGSGFIAATILALVPSLIIRGDIITEEMLTLLLVLLTLLSYEHKNIVTR